MPQKKLGLRLNQILLTVKDVERSKKFYTEKLGFNIKFNFSPEYVAVQTPNELEIGLHPPGKGSPRGLAKAQLVGIEFDVDNVDSWYDRLRKRGVTFTEKPKTSPWGEREARFKDPDGYRLAISSPAQTRKKP